MKKITLIFMLLTTAIFSWQSNAQISIGDGTNEHSTLPIRPNYGYSYTQMIYYASEINATGDVTEISFSFNGNSTLANSSDWVVYLGHTSKTVFDTTTDWIALTDLTQVHSGAITAVGAGTDELITIDITDFAYNGTDNLVIAVEENASDYDAYADSFYATTVDGNRSIHYHSDSINPDPASPPTGTLVSQISNVVLGGITVTCQKPSDLVVSNISTTDADLAWTDNASASEWEYVIQAAGTGMPTAAGTSSMTNPVTDTSLTASTSYEVYVRAICSATDSSTWVGPVTFETACNPFGDFSENFDLTPDGELATCWSANITSTDATSKVAVDSGEVELYNGADTSSVLLLVTPELTDLPNNTHRIRFKASGPAGSALQISTMDSPTGTYSLVYGFALSEEVKEYAYSFTASTTNMYVALKAVFPEVINTTIKVDDFNWEPIPSCIEPGGLTVSNITDTEVAIGWTENGAATEWEYVIQVPDSGEPTTAGTSTTTNPVTDTSLTQLTDYEVYVRAICGVGDESRWYGPVAFSTPCGVYTPDYVENFASMVTSSSPMADCWEQANNGAIADGPTELGSSGWGYEEFAHTASTGGGALNINIYTSTYHPERTDWLISPEFDLSAGGYELVLDVALTAYNSTDQRDFGSDDEVQLLYTEDGTTWNNLMTWNVSNQPLETGETVSISLTSTASVVKFALWVTNGPVSDTNDIDFHLDNFKVRTPPTCADITDVVISNETETGATIAWTENNDPAGTTWDLYIVPAGDAAPDAASTPTVDDTATNPHIWVDGTSNTAYDVYVRTDCASDNTNVSTWTEMVNFITNCSTFTAPYTEDFEDAGAIDHCWEMSGGENWNFSNTSPLYSHMGNAGVLSGNTASDNYYAWVDDSGDPTNDVTLTSPIINVDALTKPALYFYLISDNEGYSNATLNVEAYNGTTWANIATRTGNVTEWTNQVVSLAGYTGDIQVRFIVEGSSGWYDDIAIDDVVIDEGPSCYAPDSIMVSDITATGATLAVTEINDPAAAVWDFYIVPTGDAAPDAASTPTVDDGANPYIWADGTETTGYDVYVRSDCSGDNSDTSLWLGPETFTTVANCIAPSELMVTNIDSAAGTADFAWTDTNVVAPANGWEYEIVDITAGGTPTGTGVAAATNPVSVTGLVADNQYEFLVRAICGVDSESEWSTAFAWTQTEIPGCVSNPSPVDAVIDLPIGLNTFTWDAPTTGGAVVSYDVYAGETAALEFGVITNVTTETVNLRIPKYATTYYWQVVAKNGGGESIGCDVYSFTTVDMPGCGDTWTDLGGTAGIYSDSADETYTFSPDSAGDVVIVTFISFETEDNYDSLMIYDGPDDSAPLISSGLAAGNNITTCPAGSWRGTGSPGIIVSTHATGALTFVFKSDGSAGRAGWEANITCGPTPSCFAPGSLNATDVTDVSANLTWSENNDPAATEWDIEWGLAGFTQGVDGTIVSATTDNPYALTSLTAEIEYEFYVRTVCDAANSSDWAGPFAFTTAPTPPVNDDACSATSIAVNDGVLIVSNVGATMQADEPIPSCWDAESNGKSIWFSFVAVGPVAHVSTDFDTALEDTHFAVYEVTDCTDFTTFTELICAEDDNATTGEDQYNPQMDVTGLTNGVTYYVQVSGYNGTSGEFNIEITGTVVSVEELEAVGFSYYPNPVSNTLTMKANENITSVSVFNMLGQEVRNEKVSALEANIDMSNLANGTYFVKAQVGQTIGTFKIVKK